MKITVLDPVEPLTPIEVCRQTGVPMAWLQRMLKRDKISCDRSSWLQLIQSNELPRIEQMYAEYTATRKTK